MGAMTPGQRCDEIIKMIDEVLSEVIDAAGIVELGPTPLGAPKSAPAWSLAAGPDGSR
jgi:hypothetical protein